MCLCVRVYILSLYIFRYIRIYNICIYIYILNTIRTVEILGVYEFHHPSPINPIYMPSEFDFPATVPERPLENFELFFPLSAVLFIQFAHNGTKIKTTITLRKHLRSHNTRRM